MRYFRIDRRNFEVGDTITPNAAFINNISQNALLIEDLLEEKRPDTKPNRNEIVKLFNSFEAARKYWVKDPDSKFYEVEVAEDDILHKGNYLLIESLAKETDDAKKEKMANQYWEKEVDDDSTIAENFVTEAVVIKIICKDEKIRKNTQREVYGQQIIPNIGVLRNG